MGFELSLQTLPVALGIFLLRLCDIVLDTYRGRFSGRGNRSFSWILGFFQSLVFIFAVALTVANFRNLLNPIAYAAGFATGLVLGLALEERLAIANIHFTIISSLRGVAIAEQLRTDGYAVTEIPARGRNGTVTMLHVDVSRKDLDNIETIVLEADPEAFVTFENIRPLRRGFWRA
jgi:uncharacterized protein YebE (UPF0316 family)